MKMPQVGDDLEVLFMGTWYPVIVDGREGNEFHVTNGDSLRMWFLNNSEGWRYPAPRAQSPGAIRHDDEKPRFDLLPPEFLEALAQHMAAGAKKYPQNGGRNWELGMRHGRVFASLMRHAWAWMRGEDYDKETGSLHMTAVAWNAMVLVTYALRRVGEDDRPKVTK